MRIILGDNYTTYDNALEILMLAKLSDRREKLSLKFAKNCAKNELTKELFPLNSIRCKEKYRVTHANTFRLKDSAVLNKDVKKLDEQCCVIPCLVR